MKTNNDEKQEVKWGGFINEFLWMCAGVNRPILRQCPTDWAKYAGTGGTILFTAIMAALSGGYAFDTVFDDDNLAITFGVIWGLLIFNLDRYMVNTMYSDGKHTISKDELKGGLPRIILAIFLGLVISTPLEMRIFKDKISYQLIVDKGKAADNIHNANELLYKQQENLKSQYSECVSQLKELKSGNVSGLTDEIRNKEQELNEAEQKLIAEISGKGPSGRIGYGTISQKLEEQVNRLKRELNNLREEEAKDKANNQEYIEKRITQVEQDMSGIKRQLENVNQQIEDKEIESTSAQKSLNGFCAQYQALGEITAWGDGWWSKNPLFWARLFITFLFVSIEVIPTLFKMMISSGPYDDMLRARMHRVKILADKEISDINDEVNTSVEISTKQNQDRLEAEIAANKELLSQIAKAQADILSEAISLWREEEIKKVKENPSAYIQSSLEDPINIEPKK